MMQSFKEHETVLLKEAVDALVVRPEGKYIDATYGRGGHSQEILSRLSNKGCLYCIDRDPEAIVAFHKQWQGESRIAIKKQPFSELLTWMKELNLVGAIDGILFDLGVSSPQFDRAERGFSFQHDGPLDMRMDPEKGISAAAWISKVKEEEMISVFKTYGEERFAKRIAKAIIAYRTVQPITSTKQLADIVAKAHPAWEQGKHPATRVFQAIRIWINQELLEIETALNGALQVLAPQGHLVVISFHSLEDRIVKHFMRKHAGKVQQGPRGLPVIHPSVALKILGKPIYPTINEITINSRARSAVMRVAEKL